MNLTLRFVADFFNFFTENFKASFRLELPDRLKEPPDFGQPVAHIDRHRARVVDREAAQTNEIANRQLKQRNSPYSTSN